MVRRLFLSFVILFLLLPAAFAEDTVTQVSSEEIVRALTAVTDCISTALAARYSSDSTPLPCTSVSVDSESGLPQRISFFLADPADYVKFLNPGTGESSGIMSNFLSVFSKSAKSPLLYLAYSSLSSRGYNTGDCLLNGSITFEFPPDATMNELIEAVVSRKSTAGRSVIHTVDLSLYGNSFLNPVSVAGQFETNVDKEGHLVVSSVGNFKINGYLYKDSRFEF